MKTYQEWIEAWKDTSPTETELTGEDFIKAIQRDAWDSATKAQMEKDAKDEGVQAEYAFNPAPFPGDPT